VCLFGTSADPPTDQGGHLGIIQHLASMDFDEVWILPVYSHMFGTKRGKQAPFQARVEMCRLLVKDIPKAVVSEAERICFEKAAERLDEQEKSSLRIGTAELLEMVTHHEPTVDFTLALGTDTFIDLASGKWRRTEDVFRLVNYRMVVFRRLLENEEEDNGGSDNSMERKSKEKERKLRECIGKWQHQQHLMMDSTSQSASATIRIIQIPTLSNVSSSAVRRSTDVSILRGMLSGDVLEYIQQHQMYSFSQK